MRVSPLLVLVTVAASAHADPPAVADDHVARGEAFGRQGDWSRAIDAFKAADAQAPRAKHACLIGLAYSRRELWAEAELFFALCHQRATPSDPTPDWLPDAEHQLADKLATSNASAVTLRVDPPDADITISSFAPGETFHSRTIHLAAGAYVVTATAPGYKPSKQEIVVAANAPIELNVHLERSAPHSRIPYYVWAAAAGVGLTALVYDVTAVRSARADLDTKYYGVYEAGIDTYETRRTVAIALVGTAAATAITGVVLRVVLDRPPPVVIRTELGNGGGTVSIGWSR